MIEDQVGFLWFGTQDGLNRFDGYQFKVFRNDPKNVNSISDNNIWSLFEDKTGNIWAGSQNGILNCLNPQTEKFKRYILDSTSSISGNSITCLFQDKKEKLWIGTYKDGLYQLDINSGVIKHWQHDSGNKNSLSNKFVTAIIEDFKGNLWIGSYNGLCLLKDDSHNQFERFYNDPSNANSLSHNTIWTFFQSKNDPTHLWIGTYNGLTQIDVNTKKFVQFIPDKNNPDPFSRSISSICLEEKKDNVFWIGTYGGLLKLDLQNNKFDRWINQSDNPLSLCNNQVNKVLMDKSGVLWIATQKGINYYSYQKDQFSFYSKHKYEGIDLSELTGADVQAICESPDETIWIGTSKNLFSLNKSGNTFRLNKHPQFSGQNIWSLAPGNANDLWIGTYGNGLSHLDLKTGKLQHWTGDRNDPKNISNAYVRAIHQDKSGFVWIGLWGVGLNRLDPKTGLITKWSHDKNNQGSLSYDDVWVIFEDSKGRIWIGTYGGGLNLYDPVDRGTFHKWTENSEVVGSLCSNNILSIYESTQNKNSNKTILWIGTTNGLNKFSIDNNSFLKGGKFKVDIKHYFSHSEFAFNVINSISEDTEGHLWITTNIGLIEVDPETERIINNYSTYDGLKSNEFNPNSVCRTKNGEMFIGSVNGLNVFHPDSIMHSDYISPVVLTDFQIFNQPVAVSPDSPLKTSIQTADEITLAYNQNVFSFQFASLDYNAPEMNQYAYKMEGFDNDWIYSGNRRFITYTNLDPGKYIFHVKATNSDGIWNEKGKQIAIIINPPFWATWWFRSILILLFISIGPIIYYRRVTVLKREKQLQVEFSKQLIHSQEEERKRIASELHDSLGQDLLVIKNLAVMNKNKDEQFNEISKTAGSAIDEVRRISYNLHPYQLDRLGLTKAIRSMFSNIEISSKIKFDVKVEDIDKLFSKEQEINIFRIVQECVNNIIKHSSAEKSNVDIRKMDNNISIEIADNGKGFNFESIKSESKGFGLKNLENRISFLSGEIEFKSNKEFVTIVKIKIPVKNDGKD